MDLRNFWDNLCEFSRYLGNLLWILRTFWAAVADSPDFLEMPHGLSGFLGHTLRIRDPLQIYWKNQKIPYQNPFVPLASTHKGGVTQPTFSAPLQIQDQIGYPETSFSHFLKYRKEKVVFTIIDNKNALKKKRSRFFSLIGKRFIFFYNLNLNNLVERSAKIALRK